MKVLQVGDEAMSFGPRSVISYFRSASDIMQAEIFIKEFLV